jgi:hypothetical protein
MRFVMILSLTALFAAPQAFAGNPDKILNTQELIALAAKAEQATPKDQCYLYAELVRAMTEQASQQMNSGDDSATAASLQEIRQYTAKLHKDITEKSKRLRDAQIMMRYTAFRLKELMKNASLENQAVFESTLKQLDQVQSQMMLAVFQK